MLSGRVVAAGQTAEVFTREVLARAYRGLPGDAGLIPSWVSRGVRA